MTVKYLSPHHSPEDPGGLIATAIEMGEEFPGPAQDIFVGWSLRLDDHQDVTATAKLLLERFGYLEGPLPDNAAGELLALLRQAAEGSSSDDSPKRRRKGGWRSRRGP